MTAIISWLLLTDYAGKQLERISYGYMTLNCGEGKCAGVLAVYRVCLGSTLFHLVMSTGLYGVKSSADWRAKIQNGYWGFKWLFWIALIVLAFFLPNEFMAGWGKIVNIPGAAVFVLIQVVLLIDFSYTVSEQLLQWWDESGDQRYLYILILLTGACYITSITVTGFLFAWFGSAPCKLNQFFISFNLVLFIIVSFLSIYPAVQEANPKAGLAQSAMVAVYGTYLVASALSSEPVGENGSLCNPLLEQTQTQTTTVILGSLFTFLALSYSTSRAASTFSAGEDSTPLLSQQHLESAVNAGALPTSSLETQETNGPVDDEQDQVAYNYSFFHFIFVLGSMYLAMLVTNWDSVVFEKDDFAIVGRSLTAVWVKIVSGYTVLI